MPTTSLDDTLYPSLLLEDNQSYARSGFSLDQAYLLGGTNHTLNTAGVWYTDRLTAAVDAMEVEGSEFKQLSDHMAVTLQLKCGGTI